MTPEDAIRRGERAAAILNDPLVADTFAALEAEYVKQWRAAPLPEGREAIWHLLQNLVTFRGMFGAYIRSGQHAAAVRDRADEAKRQDTES